MQFHNPWFFILVPVAVFIVIYIQTGAHPPAFRFPTDRILHNLKRTVRIKLIRGLTVLRIAALVLIITALARPQQILGEAGTETEGIDIMLAVDTSTSMRAEDFKLNGERVNRLDVVKDVVKDFINNRRSDRIGIIAFAANAYTVSPLTLDYGWLMQNLDRVNIGMIEDGTAIGSGLSTALKRLKDTEAESKVLILLTDGRNNAGRISPLTAAEAAEALDIKVYTIGAGTKGLAPYPAKDLFGNRVYRNVRIEIDEQTLRKIAEKTGAKYFRATDTASMREIYKEIDELETTPIEQKGYMEYRELFHLFLIPGLLLLVLEIVLSNTALRRVP